MYYERAQDICPIIELHDLKENPDIIYDHFMNYGDEVYYVLKLGEIYGIVTPGDLYRGYLNGNNMPHINRNFSYVTSENDREGARNIFDRFPTIHEVAVIQAGRLTGVIKSGFRKSEKEWKEIRESFQCVKDLASRGIVIDDADWINKEYSIWVEKNIQALLQLKSQIYIYRWLRVEDMNLSDDDRIIYTEKNKKLISTESLYAMTEWERKIIFGDNYNNIDFITEIKEFTDKRQFQYKNGVPIYGDMQGKVINICNGNRLVPAAHRGGGGTNIYGWSMHHVWAVG